MATAGKEIWAWTGNVWKAVVDLRMRDDLDIAVLDADWGLGVLFVRPNSLPLEIEPKYDWGTFVEHRDELLRVVDVEGIWQIIGEAVPQCDDRIIAWQNDASGSSFCRP